MNIDRSKNANLVWMLFCVVVLVVVQPSFVFATDLATQAAHNEGDVNANHHDLIQGAHVEGHIAFLKAELAINSSQESLWTTVAAAMRKDVRDIEEAQNRLSQRQDLTAIEYLRNRAFFANLRAQGEQRFLKALQPLYDTFSQEQKQAANDIFITHSKE